MAIMGKGKGKKEWILMLELLRLALDVFSAAHSGCFLTEKAVLPMVLTYISSWLYCEPPSRPVLYRLRAVLYRFVDDGCW